MQSKITNGSHANKMYENDRKLNSVRTSRAKNRLRYFSVNKLLSNSGNRRAAQSGVGPITASSPVADSSICSDVGLNTDSKRTVEEAIVSAVVERESNTLLPLYVRRYRSQGALLTSRIQAPCHITLRQLGVSTGLQLEDTAFEPAVRCFARLAQQMNPRDMYQTVADLPGVICSCVDEAQLKSGKPLVM